MQATCIGLHVLGHGQLHLHHHYHNDDEDDNDIIIIIARKLLRLAVGRFSDWSTQFSKSR